jgi:hypothetical protein
LQTIYLGWFRTLILPIPTSWAARIIGMSHWCLATLRYFSKVPLIHCFVWLFQLLCSLLLPLPTVSILNWPPREGSSEQKVGYGQNVSEIKNSWSQLRQETIALYFRSNEHMYIWFMNREQFMGWKGCDTSENSSSTDTQWWVRVFLDLRFSHYRRNETKLPEVRTRTEG